MKIGPKYKIARRLGSRVFAKTQTTKFSISGSEQKSGRGGMGGGRRPKAMSEYGSQLIEKQKVRYTYGLKERQLANYIKQTRDHAGAETTPVAKLYEALELRLDNVVHRLGVVHTRTFARQLISHGHIVVNGRRLNIPSYQVRVGDVVAVRPESKGKTVFGNLAERVKDRTTPNWLSFNAEKMEGKVLAKPMFTASEGDLNLGAILEFYSRV